MKDEAHGVRSMLRQLLQYQVPWLFTRHRTIFRGVWKSGKPESGIGTGIGTGTGTGTGMGRETYIKAGTTFTLI